MRIPALIGVVLIVYFLPRLAARLGVDVQLRPGSRRSTRC